MLTVYIFETFNELNEALVDAIGTRFSQEIDMRKILFACFLILLIFAYLLFWRPFVGNLSKEL